jgi:hypothetical protein
MRVAFRTAVASEARHGFGFAIRELTNSRLDFAATKAPSPPATAGFAVAVHIIA